MVAPYGSGFDSRRRQSSITRKANVEMRKKANVELDEIDEHTTFCGYRAKDLILVTRFLESRGVTPETVKRCARNLRDAYQVLAHEIERASIYREDVRIEMLEMMHYQRLEEQNEKAN